MTRNSMSDHELDRLLAMASKPVAPEGAEARLMAKLNPENVIAFRQRQGAERSALSWLAALPLAASLAFGLWLGIAGVGANLLPESLGGDSVAAIDDAAVSGIDEAEAMAEESQT